jgi:hypothetical protein
VVNVAWPKNEVWSVSLDCGATSLLSKFCCQSLNLPGMCTFLLGAKLGMYTLVVALFYNLEHFFLVCFFALLFKQLNLEGFINWLNSYAFSTLDLFSVPLVNIVIICTAKCMNVF